MIQVVVQYHPARAHLLASLLTALPAETLVVTDPGAGVERANSWRAYRTCLEAIAPAATHLCVIQDDAQVCRDFGAALPLLVARRPDELLCLFTPGVGGFRKRILSACAAERRWTELDPHVAFVPLVAAIWPRPLVERVLAFADRFGPRDVSDDGNVWTWAKAETVRPVACVPSLVEHPDREPSLMGKPALAGRHPGRVACCWIGETLSPLALDW